MPLHILWPLCKLCWTFCTVCVCMVGCVPPAASLVINWILVTPFSLAYKSWVLCTAFHSNTTTWCNAQCAICTKVHFPHCVLHAIHRSYELTRLNVQILIQTILSAYYQIHNSIMILSCVFFPSRGWKQIVSFVSTPRKSRPPLGEGEEEVDSKVGKNWAAGQKVARVNLLRARRAP